MRRVFLLSAFCLAAGSISACKPDETISTENIPTAGVRFINAVPDTSGAFGFDFRWIDQLENNAHFRMTYRNGPGKADSAVNSTQVQYKAARAGTGRIFRVFLDDTLQALASRVLVQDTVDLVAGRLYTAIMWGDARAATMRVDFFEETAADPGVQASIRVINATASPIDIRRYVQGGTVPAVTDQIVPARTASLYANVAIGRWRVNVRDAGSGAPIIAYDPYVMVGDTAFSTAGPGGRKDIEARPGTRVAGSAVTLIVYPPSVAPQFPTAANQTPQTTSATPGLSFVVPAGISVWDRRPPSVVVP